MAFRDAYAYAVERVEAYLNQCFLGEPAHVELYQAMRYSLLAGGKRIRPVLTLKFAAACGLNESVVMPAACAVEMIHTYSLIHDDLPCMDNDVLRRGKPTNHVVFGECTATLAGDALQAAAFATLLSAKLPAENLVACARILAASAGQDGMCAGQVLDMEGENRAFRLDEIENLHERKTGAMIKAACMIGVSAAGGSEKELAAAEKYAAHVGLAFQIRDDVLDVTSTAEAMGKSIGKDAVHGKSTFVSLLGIEACEKRIMEETEEACRAVSFMDRDGFLSEMAQMLSGRKN